MAALPGRKRRKEEQIPPGIETCQSLSGRWSAYRRKEEQIPPGIETFLVGDTH